MHACARARACVHVYGYPGLCFCMYANYKIIIECAMLTKILINYENKR